MYTEVIVHLPLIDSILLWNEYRNFNFCFGILSFYEFIVILQTPRTYTRAYYYSTSRIGTLTRFDSVPSNGGDISIVLRAQFVYTLRSIYA